VNALRRAARELAACPHPPAHVQMLFLCAVQPRRVRRCALCGAVRYGRERRWTRPELVAHVAGAEAHA